MKVLAAVKAAQPAPARTEGNSDGTAVQDARAGSNDTKQKADAAARGGTDLTDERYNAAESLFARHDAIARRVRARQHDTTADGDK